MNNRADKGIVLKLYEILPKNQKWKFIILLILLVFSTLLELLGIGMIPIFISILSNPEQLFNANYIGPILDRYDINNSTDLLVIGGLTLIIINLVKGIYIIFVQYIKSKYVYSVFEYMATNLFKIYMHLPYTFHVERNSAQLITNVTNETRFVAGFVLSPFLNILMQGITSLGIFVLLLSMEPIITLLAFLLLGLSGGSLIKLLKTKLREYGEVAANERSRMIQGVNEGIGGLKDVAITNRHNFFLDRFNQYVNNFKIAEIFKQVSSLAVKPSIEFIAISGMILISIILVYQGRPINSVIPILALFGVATVRLMPAVSQIISDIQVLKYYKSSLDPLYDDISNYKKYSNQNIHNERSKNEVLSFKKGIIIENVTFNYPNSNEYVLKDISLKIEAGSVIGIVGTSGAGKSTLVDIILGLLKPDSGKVIVDGKDIHKNLTLWQNNIGYIPQSIFLTDDTIKNNIAFGIKENEIDKERIKRTIKSAQLTTLLMTLDNGVDTIIGERGSRLSGGQKQRIGIARAIYDNPKILIMDEATSALDNVTESEVMKSIENLKKGRTIIMIAHRLSTVKNCDKIIFMKDGSVLSEGNYEHLMQTSEEFKNLAEADSK